MTDYLKPNGGQSNSDDFGFWGGLRKGINGFSKWTDHTFGNTAPVNWGNGTPTDTAPQPVASTTPVPIAGPMLPQGYSPSTSTPQTSPNVMTAGYSGASLAPSFSGQQQPPDISSLYSNNNGTISNNATGQAFSNPQQFFSDLLQNTGYQANSFDGLKFGSPNASGNGVTHDVSLNPTAQTDTNTTSGSSTLNDIQKAIQENLNKQDSFVQQLQGLVSPSSQEQQALDQYTNLSNSMISGNNDIMKKPIPLEFQQGQQAALQRDFGGQLQGLGNIYQNLQQTRQSKLQTAQTLYNAYSSSFQNKLDVLTKLAPQNIGVQTNQNTGDTYAVTRDPFTGATTMTKMGNIGPGNKQATIQQIGQHFDENTGQMINDYGVASYDDKGNVQIHPINSSGQLGTGSSGNGAGGGVGGSTPAQQPYLPSDPNAGSVVTNVASAIGQFESGGNYSAVNKDTGALGKYQVMPSNVPGWTQAALGQSLTPAQFLASPQAQDAVAQFKIGQYLQQFGSPQGVMGAWIGGPGYAKNLSAADANGTSVASYISKVSGIYNNLTSQQVSQQGAQTAANTTNAQAFQQIVQSAPTIIRNSIHQLPDGTPYIDSSELSGSAVAAAQAYSGRTGLRALSSEDAKGVDDVKRSISNLNTLAYNFSQLAKGGAAGAFTQNVTGPLNQLFDTQTGQLLKAYTKNRDALFQQINALAGSNPRINQQELVTAANALPTLQEFNHDTLADGLQKLAITQNYLDNAIRVSVPNYIGSPIQTAQGFVVKAPDSKLYTFNSKDSALAFMAQASK